MREHLIRRICLSVLFFLGMAVQVVPVSPVYSQPDSPVEAGPVNPPQKIISSTHGLEKLSPDLKDLAAGENQPFDLSAAVVSPQPPVMVSALYTGDVNLSRFFQKSVQSKPVAGHRWVTGKLDSKNLLKLASVPEVTAVYSIDTFDTAEAPGLDALRLGQAAVGPEEARALLAEGGPALLAQQPRRSMPVPRSPFGPLAAQAELAEAGLAPDILDIHDVRSAREAGYDGDGVVVAVVDTGVDFGHPDLIGTQAVIPTGDYAGWPFAYDVISGAQYALEDQSSIGPDNYWGSAGWTQFAHALPVQGQQCSAASCAASLVITQGNQTSTSVDVTWPNRSKSGVYYYTVHPDFYLAYAAYGLGIQYSAGMITPAVVLVSDEGQAGVYDTVYADADFDASLFDASERMTKAQPVAGADLNGDGVWDLSAGMLTWISDGSHHPPGVEVVYDLYFPPPQRGRLITFLADTGTHGTNCASEIVGQGRITDPYGYGPTNPLYAGAAMVGGVGGPVVKSVAPAAKVAALQNGFDLPLDAWAVAALGMDGEANSGDEANIISNSWGDSGIAEDGWDAISRFAQQISMEVAPQITFLAATGNGGHGYGTVTTPGGGSTIDVGASTAYGTVLGFEPVGPGQFLHGEVQPWSNRGPGGLGDPAPDVVAVGAYGTGANPLNVYYAMSGQAAYDVFGGTSMSTPVASGVLAMVYQAFHETHSRWPTWQEARTILFGSAADLGYDVFVQGAGSIQASRAVALAQGAVPSVSPVQWQAGDYRGLEYPAYPSLLAAGQQDTQVFTLTNPTGQPVTFSMQDFVLKQVHEATFTIPYASPVPTSVYELPHYLKDLTGLIDQYSPDMVRAQVSFPYEHFDEDNNGYADEWWSIHFYNWSDHNQDGNLWSDWNRNLIVDVNEIDLGGETGVFEFNRFTYGYPQSTVIEASLGSEGLSQRDDGVFLGLRCNFCGHSSTLQVRVTFYQRADWDWLSVSSPLIEVPAGGEPVSFSAVLDVPAGAAPGVYDGALEVRQGAETTIIPVVAQVAADSPTFTFGGRAARGTPFENGQVSGGFNWNWRAESGDWRFFYYDLLQGTGGPGKAMIVDTRWASPRTDIDTLLFGPFQPDDDYLAFENFGPTDLRQTGSSKDNYVFGGLYKWGTNTGYSREMVTSPVSDGLGMIALHNVLSGGEQPVEVVSGSVFQLSTQPGEIIISAEPDDYEVPHLTGEETVTLTTTRDLDEGVQILPYGFSVPIHLTDQTIDQNATSSVCSAGWGYRLNEGGLNISRGGQLEITTTSQAENLDLDLYVFKDNGDGRWNCSREKMVFYSIDFDAEESIKVNFPEDGRYWILAYGLWVPNLREQFDITIRAVQGNDLRLSGVPVGPIEAGGSPIEFTTEVNTRYPASTFDEVEGLLMIGLPGTPDLLEVPVRIEPTVLLYPPPSVTMSSSWIHNTPENYALTFKNLGTIQETVEAVIELPAGMTVQIGSVDAPGIQPTVDLSGRTITWSGVIGGRQQVDITFRAYSLPDSRSYQSTIRAAVTGVTSGQSWVTTVPVWVNLYGQMLPVIRR